MIFGQFLLVLNYSLIVCWISFLMFVDTCISSKLKSLTNFFFHHPDQSRDWRIYQNSFCTVSRYIKNTWQIDIILYFWKQIYRPIKFKVNVLSFNVPDLDFTFLEMNPFTFVNGKPYPLDMRGELDDTAAFKNFKKYVPFWLVDFYHSCFISLWMKQFVKIDTFSAWIATFNLILHDLILQVGQSWISNAFWKSYESYRELYSWTRWKGTIEICFHSLII